MAEQLDGNTRAFTADGAIAKYARVFISSGKVSVATVGASHEWVEIGTLQNETFADGDPATVRLHGSGGTAKMIAAGAITIGQTVYGAASGKVSTTTSGGPLGVALNDASADGDIVEVLATLR